MARISPEQYETIRQVVREKGNLALAAHAAGMSASGLKALLARDADLAQEIADCMELFNGALFAHALERATKSDTILVKVLEARMPSDFTSEGRKVAMAATNRIGAIKLRTFDEDGNDVSDGDLKPKEKETAVPMIGYYDGI